MTRQLLHHDGEQDFTIRKSDKAKRVTLRVNPKTRGVELVVPKRVSYKYALEFAATQRAWITARKVEMADRTIPLSPIDARDLKKQARAELTRLTMEKVALLPQDTSSQPSHIPAPSSHIPAKAGIHAMLQYNFFHMLDSRIRGRVKSWNHENIKIRICDSKTQWGSCHPDGRISFSWRLMLAPEEARDYVVAHEVAHLIHNNHSRQFWELCKKLSTDFKTGHDWMKENGTSLHNYHIV